MKAFIKGVGNISPQPTYDNSTFLETVLEIKPPYAHCIEPDYKKFITPKQLRRMGKVLKMGITASIISLKDAAIDNPDAVIAGTGLGMIQDTEKFLTTMIKYREKYLNPTAFIQSTHNTVAAYIAVMLNCNGYNYTYVHNNISFESALIDSLMQVNENKNSNILVGSVDEMTDEYFQITEKAGFWRENTKDDNAIVGQGASFFVMTGKPDKNNYAEVKGVSTFYKPENQYVIIDNIKDFLNSNGLDANDIDILITGDINENVNKSSLNGMFKNSGLIYHKNLCGEYFTSSAFATWMAAKILKHQTVPKGILWNDKNISLPLKNVLIYNRFKNKYHSVILLSAI